jgi:hypothetical protein
MRALRLIAVDRALHVLVLAALAIVILIYATHQRVLDTVPTRVLMDIHGGVGGPVHIAGGSITPASIGVCERLLARPAAARPGRRPAYRPDKIRWTAALFPVSRT